MFPKTLKVINIYLIIIGITYLCGRKNCYYASKYYWQAFCCIMMGAMVLPQVAYAMTYADDFVALPECVLLTVTFIVAFAKLACHMKNRSEIKDIIDAFIFREFELNIPFLAHIRDSDADEKTLNKLRIFVKESNKKLMNIIKYCLMIYGGASASLVTMQAMKPIVLGMIYPESHHGEFPYLMLYPWNQSTSPNYEITFFLDFCFGAACAISYVGLDCLFVLLFGHIIRQLMIVGFIMSHLDELVAELRQKDSAEWERDSTALLANCAQHVIALKWYCERLNRIYQPFLVVQAVASSGIICLCMWMIAKTEDGNKVSLQNFMYLFFEFEALVQIGMYCAVGQILQDESEKLQDKAVGSWWDHDRRYQTCVRILLLALQRPIAMNIWGTIDLSHYTYGAITKTGVSYYMLLRTISEK